MQFPANISRMCSVELALKGLTSAGKGLLHTSFPRSLTDGYAMLMSPSKGETAVDGFHCLSDMTVRMHEVMASLWVGVCVPLALSLHYYKVQSIFHQLLYFMTFLHKFNSARI